ncbi:hypothetical protein SLEP1_g5082 [Rubroshorea leprosula]|uniref:C3H1-type domain-containing protein n=1 Tax=Rubroshorea leprosula TaxID=152421 RepID=A0AAV5HZS0_9ROSI|nr:hypothetical protein SLEP1_g5082 [Rubroshorea leprosula]
MICQFAKGSEPSRSARKRHLQGLQHLRVRAQWYHSLSDPNQAFADPFAKGVCNHFVKTGFCQYGDNCKYFHPKNNLQNAHPRAAPDAMNTTVETSWGNLPPSLKPPPEGGYLHLPVVDWG